MTRILVVLSAVALALVLMPSAAQAHTTGSHSHCIHSHAAEPWGGQHMRINGRCYYLHGHQFYSGPTPPYSGVPHPGGPTGPDGIQLAIALMALMGVAGVGGYMIERRHRFGRR